MCVEKGKTFYKRINYKNCDRILQYTNILQLTWLKRTSKYEHEQLMTLVLLVHGVRFSDVMENWICWPGDPSINHPQYINISVVTTGLNVLVVVFTCIVPPHAAMCQYITINTHSSSTTWHEIILSDLINLLCSLKKI